jgi:acyl-CoA synthetase (AMP-forming)/AMP-acid ligase II
MVHVITTLPCADSGKEERVVVGKIYAHALQMPEKAALIYSDHRISYRVFAGAIDGARRYFGTLGLPGRGLAVLAIWALPDGWVAGLALRSLGLTTVGVRSAGQIGQLCLRDIQCVVTSEAEQWPGLEALCAAASWREVSIPSEIYADATMAAAPPVPTLLNKQGAHILLTSGTTGSYKKVLMIPGRRAIQTSLRANMAAISGQSVVNVANNRCWTAIGYHFTSITWELGGTVIFDEVNLSGALQCGEVTHFLRNAMDPGAALLGTRR